MINLNLSCLRNFIGNISSYRWKLVLHYWRTLAIGMCWRLQLGLDRHCIKLVKKNIYGISYYADLTNHILTVFLELVDQVVIFKVLLQYLMVLG